jgi:hypothetical protein
MTARNGLRESTSRLGLHNNARCVSPCHDFLSAPLPSVALRCPLRCPPPVVHRLPVVRCARENKLFLTRLLTSEDEYKWYWHQMIYFPETINTVSTSNTILPSHSLFSSCYAHHLLCACWHLEVVDGSSSLTSCRLFILSRLVPSLIWDQLTLLVHASGSPPSPRWRPHSQGPRTLPYRDPEQ